MRTDHRRHKSKTRPQGPKPPEVKPPQIPLCPNFDPASTKPCPRATKGSTQPCPAKSRNSSARGSRIFIAPVDTSRGGNAFFQYEPAKPKACCQCPSTNEVQSASHFPCCPCPPSVQQQGFSRAIENANNRCCECPSALEQDNFAGSECCECPPQGYPQNNIISTDMDGWNRNNSECCSCPPQVAEQLGNNLRSSLRQSNKNLNSFIPQRQTNSIGPTTYDQCCQCPSLIQMQQYQSIPGDFDQCCPCPQNLDQQFSNNFAAGQQQDNPGFPRDLDLQCCTCSQTMVQQFENNPNPQCCACPPPFEEQQYGDIPRQVEQECCPCLSTRNKEVYIDMPDEESYTKICVPPSQLSHYRSQAQQTKIPKTADQSCCVCSQEMIPKPATRKAHSKRSPGHARVPCEPCLTFRGTYDQPTSRTDRTDYPTVYSGCPQTTNKTALHQSPIDNCKCNVSEQDSWTYVMAPAYVMNPCAGGCQSTLCCKICKRSLPTYCFPCPRPCHP